MYAGFADVLTEDSFHTFLNTSPRLWYLTSQLDHLGIVIVIWGSVVPSAHFGFHDNPTLRHFYWNLVSIRYPYTLGS